MNFEDQRYQEVLDNPRFISSNQGNNLPQWVGFSIYLKIEIQKVETAFLNVPLVCKDGLTLFIT
jgi:hypothetical protein